MVSTQLKWKTANRYLNKGKYAEQANRNNQQMQAQKELHLCKLR